MGCVNSKAEQKDSELEQKVQGDSAASSEPTNNAHSKLKSSALSSPKASGLREAVDKPLVIFIIGGPGSGKGTQCKMIVEKYGGGCRHLSTGDLLRAEVSKGSELGKEIGSKMKSGKLVSDDQVIAVLEREISSSAWFGLAFLVDGFPRTTSQAEKFEQKIRPSDAVLYFDCPESVLLERLNNRGKSSGRNDDTPSVLKKRLKSFQKQTLPVVDFYNERRKLHKISAVPPPKEVFEKVSAILDERFDEATPEDAAATKGAEWRPKLVADITKQFYGASQ